MNKKDQLKQINNIDIQYFKSVFHFSEKNGFKLKTGTGKTVSLSLQFLDSEKRHKTILTCYKGKIEIPGNLYGQKKFLNVEESFINSFFQNICSIFPQNKLKFTKAGTLQIADELLSKDKMKRILNEVQTFTNQIDL